MSETTSMDIVFAAAIARDAKSLEADVTVRVASPGCGALFRHVFGKNVVGFLFGSGKIQEKSVQPISLLATHRQSGYKTNQLAPCFVFRNSNCTRSQSRPFRNQFPFRPFFV
jgi:hypothetical protein